MSGPLKAKILHLGNIQFPISWTDWYAGVERVLDVQLQLETSNQLAANERFYFDYLFTRISPELATQAYSLFTAPNPLIHQIQFVDFIYRKGDALWPHLLLKDAVHSLVVKTQPFVHGKGSGLIVGGSPEAFVTCHTLIEIGMKHVTFVVEKELDDDGLRLFQTLTQSLFDVKIDIINIEQLIMLSGIYSIMICFENLKQQTELQTALLYFNYLVRGGAIFNMSHSIEQTPIMEEAQAIQAVLVDLKEVQVHQEIEALQKLFKMSEAQISALRRLALV